MSNIQQVTDTIVAQGILPLYFNADETVSVEILKVIYGAGIKAVEYTNRGDAALSNFKKIDRKSTRLNSSHGGISRMPSSA